MTMMATPPRLAALRNASQSLPQPTISEALRALFMSIMEYFHARSRAEAPMPPHILVLVRALQDSRNNRDAMQAMTLMNALQSLSCDEIAGDPKIARALAKARSALVSTETEKVRVL